MVGASSTVLTCTYLLAETIGIFARFESSRSGFRKARASVNALSRAPSIAIPFLSSCQYQLFSSSFRLLVVHAPNVR